MILVAFPTEILLNAFYIVSLNDIDYKKVYCVSTIALLILCEVNGLREK